MGATTSGLVCAHHHLYSALARGMPAPPVTPHDFAGILEQVWWRLDTALDLEMLRASARLGAVEALLAGTTGIVDHHESPHAIEGSLDVIADACSAVGVRVVCAYGVTDRHGADGARRGLAENERFLRAGGRGMVGVHAAFTSTSPKGVRTSVRTPASSISPVTTGCSPMPSISTSRCRARSLTTPEAT